MIPEEMQRTMQFLLENQAAHDARLAAIEINLDKLSIQTSNLARTQQELQEGMHSLQEGMQSMQGEFREGIQKILTASEQTLASVRQIAEAEVRTIKRVNVLEDRVDALENSSK